MPSACHAATASTSAPGIGVYQRRRPERTVAYEAVQQQMESWLSRQRLEHPDGDAVPHYVESDLRGFLRCGILAHGFAKARCDDCGHDFLIAFSCKGRGICPSCNTKRMACTAAHLVENVLPKVPLRQVVVSFPKWLRHYLNHDAELFNRVIKANSLDAPADSQTGGIVFIHRFGSALNAHPHFGNCSCITLLSYILYICT